jgi:glycosyltransferase involved in cell wall biosynthesis
MLARHFDVDFLFFSDGAEKWIEKKNTLQLGKYNASLIQGIRVTDSFRINTDLLARLHKVKYDTIIQVINGRFELLASFLYAKLTYTPFILWTNLWAHPQTFFHRCSFPVVQYIYRNADAVVAYGYHVRDYLVPLGVNERKIFYSWNVADNSLFNKSVSEEVKQNLYDKYNLYGKKVLLFVGRLVEEKGLQYLLPAIKKLPETLAVKLLIIGCGEKKESLLGFVKKNTMVNVEFIDFVKNEELINYYAISDCLLLPSITTPTFKEPWGIVINEAMNQGCPVIATNAVGAAMGGLVQSGKNGIVVPERNSDVLRNAIVNLFSDEGKLAAMKKFTQQEIQLWDENKSLQGFSDAIEFVHKKN